MNLCVCNVLYVSTEVCHMCSSIQYGILLHFSLLKKNEKKKPQMRDFNQISRDKKLLTMSTAARAGPWEEGWLF